MVTKIYDYDMNLITDAVGSYLPRKDTIQISNRLLDGSYHIQVLGTAANLVDITCSVRQAGKNKLDELQAYGGPVIVERDGAQIEGIIIAAISWNEAMQGPPAKRRFTGKFTINTNQDTGGIL